MHKVLRVGRRASTLITQDFQIWKDQKSLKNLQRAELSIKYAKIANDRWKSFKVLSNSKIREIAQQLWSLMQSGNYY